MEENKEYYAFISYKREDEKWAKWLQNKLEHYKFPTNLNGRTDLPKNIRPTFRDVTDLKPGLLAEEIENALRNSEWLIVVCSPRSAKSPWVCKEAQTFIDLGRADHIIPFVIEGNPFSDDPTTECYPEALFNLTGSKELLAANINEMGRDAAAIKVVARMFNLHFDALWQRHEREQRRRRNRMRVFAVIAFLCISGVAFWMYWQNQQTQKANWNMMENQARAVAEKAQKLVGEGDSYTAQLIALEVLPKDLGHPNRPYTQEAETALRNASYYNSCVLSGHTGAVNSVAYSPNDSLIVSASNDTTIRIWDSKTGIELFRLKGHSKKVVKAVFSPDGRHIASASDDGMVKIWDTVKRRCVFSLDGHHEALKDISFNKEGKLLASASENTIVVWDVKNWKKRQEIKPEGKIRMVKFHPNGRQLISSLGDTLVVWDAYTTKLIKEISCNFSDTMYFENSRLTIVANNDVSDICVSTGEVACSDFCGHIFIYDLETGTRKASYEKNKSTLNAFVFSNDSKKLYTASSSGVIESWTNRLDTDKEIMNYPNSVTCLAISNDDANLLFSSSDHTIHQLSLLPNSKKIKAEIPYEFSGSSLSNNKKIIARADYDSGEIMLSKISDGKMSKKHIGLYHLRIDRIYGVSISSNGEMAALFGDTCKHKENRNNYSFLDFKQKDYKKYFTKAENVISNYRTYIIDLKTSKRIGMIKSKGKTVFSPDDRLIALYNDSVICLYDTKHFSLQKKLVVRNGKINAIAFSPIKEELSSISSTGMLQIWDLKSGECAYSRKTAIENSKILYSDIGNSNIIYSPNGKLIALSGDAKIELIDAYKGKTIRVFSGHKTSVRSINFSNDGSLLVSTSSDGTIRVWDVSTGVERGVINIDSFMAFFSSDNKHVISLYNDEIRTFEFPPLQQLIDRTRDRFKNRKLTPEERRKYYLE